MSAEIGYQTWPHGPAYDDDYALGQRIDKLTADYLLDYERVRGAVEQAISDGADLSIDLASALTAWERTPANAHAGEFAAILHRLMRYLEDQVRPTLEGRAKAAALRERAVANDL